MHYSIADDSIGTATLTRMLSRIYGCWVGKSIGGTLGLPAEGKMERLDYTFYNPVPLEAPPNDDLELQLVWLHLVEKTHRRLTRADFADAWLKHIHYMWDEYGRCRWNLRRGVPLDLVGTFENPFHAGMGSPIRSEIWACLFPGDPESAAYYAALDASLDHGLEGIAGEVFLAVMQSLIIAGFGIVESITTAISSIPASSETAQAIRLVLQSRRTKAEPWSSRSQLLAKFGNENFTHAPLNVALTVWALLYGENDFEETILLAVNGGYDTDCTAATAGATIGMAFGIDSIPSRWRLPIGDGVFIGPGIRGISAPKTLNELSVRTANLVGKLDRASKDQVCWPPLDPTYDLANLPGSISMLPLASDSSALWSNGELPATVKAAGGATWEWEVVNDAPRNIICLARSGARLYIDNKLAVECPSGLPYVPATHRSPEGSQVSIHPRPGMHTVRLELASKDQEQQATLLLAYPNLHICPWTAQELPHEAHLPSPQ